MSGAKPPVPLRIGGFDPAGWVLAHWRLASILWFLIFALGLAAFGAIPRTEDPVLQIPEFAVTAVLPGADPVSAEQQLTKPIENAIYHLDGVEQVRSYTSNNVAYVSVRFRWGTNVGVAYNDFQREMDALRPSLPQGLTKLEVIRFSNNRVAIRVAALTSDLLPMRRLDKLARRLRDQLGGIPGVREVTITGLIPSEVAVAPDAGRLAALGLSVEAVIDALHNAGAEAPVGKIDAGTRRFNVNFSGAYPDLAAIRSVALPFRDGSVVRVGDVAQVHWELADVPDLARFNGQRAVLLAVSADDGQDVGQLSPALDRVLSQFERSLPGGVRLAQGFDQSVNIASRIGHLERDFLIALALVSITILPIGGRAAIVVLLAIPLSLLLGVLVLYASGFTLNQLSIAGFVLSLGLLVDDAIVVVENIGRWRRDGHATTAAVIGATRQVGLAVLGCTACLIFAFIPLAALPDASGAFIRSLPVAVFATVSASLLVALTAIPLAARLMLNSKDDAGSQGGPLLQRLNIVIHRFYAPVLHRALSAPKRWLGGLYALCLLAVPAVMMIGTSLFPSAGLPQFIIDLNAGQGTTLARTEELVARVEARARLIPGVRWVSTNVGRTGPRLYYNLHETEGDPGFAQVAVGLSKWDDRAGTALLTDLRREFASIAGADVSVSEFKQGNIVEAPVAIRISGPDLGRLTALAERADAVMKTTPGLIDVKNPLRRERSDIRFVADDAAVAAHGVAPGALRETLRIALTGASPANLRDSDGDAWPVVVRLRRDPGMNGFRLADLATINVPAANGQIPLASLVTARMTSGPATIDRVDRVSTVTLTANVAPGFLVSRVTDQALARIQAALTLPANYGLSLVGEASEQTKSFGNLGPALMIAAFGILAVLVIEFGRLRSVVVVFGIVPFGVLGAILALLLTGNSLSFTAMIGLVALIGIEIKNSILLVDFTEQLRGQGLGVREAVERAGELRFLPVLLTSLTAIGGLLPLALEGNGLYSPLSIVLIGGLLSSTILARIATPVMYLLIAGGERA